jgi:cell division protein FtsA
VKAEIIRLGCEDLLASGAVITGGTTQLAGMTELGEEMLGIPVRRGAPKGVGGLAEVVRNAAFSTSVGLVQYGVSKQTGERPSGESPSRSGGGLFSRLRRSLSNAF